MVTAMMVVVMPVMMVLPPVSQPVMVDTVVAMVSFTTFAITTLASDMLVVAMLV